MKLVFAFCMAIVVNFVPLAHAQTAQKAMSSDEQAVYIAAMNLLTDEDYSALEEFQKRNQTGAITILADDQLSLLTKDKDSIKTMKSKSMFCLGEAAAFPIYVRRESLFFTSLMAGYIRTKDLIGVESHPSSMAFAAKISHEIYHVRNPDILQENEVSAIEHEQKIFESYMQKYISVLNLAGLKQIAQEHVASLQNDLEIAKGNR